MTGFDCQFSGHDSVRDCRQALFAFLDAHAPANAVTADTRAVVTDFRDSLEKAPGKPALAESHRVRAGLQQIQSALAKPLPSSVERRDTALWQHVVANLLVLETMRSEKPNNGPESTNRRDATMAANLAYLANSRYVGKKIIVWAASFHLMHNAATIQTPNSESYRNTIPMGQTVSQRFGPAVYTIAFTAYQGSQGNPFFSTHTLPKASADSVEGMLHDTGSPFAFVDLRHLSQNHWLRTPQTARPLGYTPMIAVWPQIIDAFFFTDTMFPSTTDGDVPDVLKSPH